MSDKQWSPPEGLLELHWKLIVPACCLGLEDECEILDTGNHFLDAAANDIKLELLSSGMHRLQNHLALNGWPEEPDEVELAFAWMRAYIDNIEYFLATGQHPPREEITYEARAVAGRRKHP